MYVGSGPDMPSDASGSQPSEPDRRADFCVNVILSVTIQVETDTTAETGTKEGEIVETPVNINGGSIGVTVNRVWNPEEILSVTLVLADQGSLKPTRKCSGSFRS